MSTSSSQRSARPFLPSDRTQPRDHFFRTATAMLVSQIRAGGPDGALHKLYGDDEASQLVLRAAVSGATTTGTGWAAELAQASVSDLVTNLGPVSAGSQLLKAGFVVPQERGELGTSVPAMVATAGGAAFVGEGSPAPVVQFAGTAVALPPRKITSLVVYSRGVAKRTNFEQIVRATLTESVGLALDSVMFGTAAGSAVVPAGLLNAVTPLTASNGGGSGGDAAMMNDLARLAATVAPVGGDRIAFVAAPGQAVAIRLRASPAFPYPIFSASALASGTVAAVALPAIAAAIDPVPEFEVANAATLHMENATPAQIAPSGGPISAPVQSMFQTDSLALKVTLGVSYATRASGSVAVVNAVTW